MPVHFQDLATELVEQIADSLAGDSLCSLRLVCKDLSAKSSNIFYATAFATVKTSLSSESIKRLYEISEREHIAPYVKSLRITHSTRTLGQGFQWPRYKSGRLRPRQQGKDLLRNILGVMVNCRSFHIDAWDEIAKPYPHSSDFILPSDAVCLILSMVMAGDFVVNSLTVRSDSKRACGLDSNRILPMLGKMAIFETAWVHLTELNFNFNLTQDLYEWAFYQISRAPQLRSLTLAFYEIGRPSFGETKLLNRLRSLTSLCRLKTLSLRRAYVSFDTLDNIISNNINSLHTLELDYITLELGTWTAFFDNLRRDAIHLHSLYIIRLGMQTGYLTTEIHFPGLLDESTVVNTAQGLYRHFQKADSRILQGMSQAIDLRYQGRAEKGKIKGVSYAGSEMDILLDALARSVEPALKLEDIWP